MPEAIHISLASPDVSVEPGAAVEVEALIRNDGPTADSAAIEVEFAEPSWIALPVSGVALDPGQSRPVRIVFKAPRASAASTGDYPYVVRSRSIETGSSSAAQGTLHVKPYHSFLLSVTPGRARGGPFNPRLQYEVRVENQGNAPETYDLSAADPDRACVYQMPAERVEVAPGESVEVPLAVESRRRSVIAPTRLHGFEVKAAPLSGSVPPETTHGQYEYRPVISPAAAAALLLLIVGSIWYAWQRGQGPQITLLEARPSSIVAGQPSTLVYAITHLNRTTKLMLKNESVNAMYPIDPTNTTTIVQPDQTTSYALIAQDDQGRRSVKRVKIQVTPVTPLPPPAITSFRADPSTINFGATTLLSWKVTGAQSLFLEPYDKPLDPALTTFQDSPRQTTTYSLVAKNKDGAVVRKTVRVVVVPPPSADAPQIAFFSATPPRVSVGEPITLSWNVTGASTVSIPGIGLVENQGSRTFQSERSSRFTLIAAGPSGLQSEKSVNVEVVQPARILTFTARPGIIQPGGTTHLAWSVHNAESVNIRGVGPVDREGSLDVKPDKTTVYTLRASDATGHTTEETATVTVATPAGGSPPAGSAPAGDTP